MKRKFGDLITEYLLKDERIWLLTGDLGFGVLDAAKEMCPERYVNTGASEQLLVGAGVGLAQSNCIPICYSITPFLVFRPFEFIRNYVNHEECPVKLVGIGRDKDYLNCGFSHWAEDVDPIMDLFTGIKKYKPNTANDLESMWEEFLYNDKPCYLNLTR